MQPQKGSRKGNHDKKEKNSLPLLAYESSVFTGSHREHGDAMICPELLDYVAKEVERDASIMKQVRKAREERAEANK